MTEYQRQKKFSAPFQSAVPSFRASVRPFPPRRLLPESVPDPRGSRSTPFPEFTAAFRAIGRPESSAVKRRTRPKSPNQAGGGSQPTNISASPVISWFLFDEQNQQVDVSNEPTSYISSSVNKMRRDIGLAQIGRVDKSVRVVHASASVHIHAGMHAPLPAGYVMYVCSRL